MPIFVGLKDFNVFYSTGMNLPNHNAKYTDKNRIEDRDLSVTTSKTPQLCGLHHTDDINLKLRIRSRDSPHTRPTHNHIPVNQHCT